MCARMKTAIPVVINRVEVVFAIKAHSFQSLRKENEIALIS